MLLYIVLHVSASDSNKYYYYYYDCNCRVRGRGLSAYLKPSKSGAIWHGSRLVKHSTQELILGKANT